MNPQPKDAPDREIDLVLASIAAEEPIRVNAASVRRAMGERRASRIPMWFAAAAILILAVGLLVTSRTPAEKTPEVIARSGAAPVAPEVRITPSIEPERAQHNSQTRQARRPGARANSAAEPPYEGLPRLVVDSIDLPEPLGTSRLDADALQIEQIEIAPLLVSILPDAREPKQ